MLERWRTSVMLRSSPPGIAGVEFDNDYRNRSRTA